MDELATGMSLRSGEIIVGDCRAVLRTLEANSVHCCVTSPPYWGLRDYRVEGQLGLELTPQEFVANLVEVFGEVWRVLRMDGTLWLNLGDSYNAYNANRGVAAGENKNHHEIMPAAVRGLAAPSLKPKDLIGMPWRVAFALQEDGWTLRSEIIWHKPNPMPESVRDRPTKSHETLFLFSKHPRYYYDAAAIAEPVEFDTESRYERGRGADHKWADGGPGDQTIAKSFDHMKRSGNKERKPASARGVPVDTNGSSSGAVAGSIPWEGSTRNKRSVWTIATQPFSGSHFATFPTALVEPCIKAGSPRGGVIIDPFFGAGTTGLVASRLGRRYIGIELNEEYARMADARIVADAPLLNATSLRAVSA